MNQQETNKVWRGLLDAERYTRYYSRLAEKFSRWNRVALSVIAALTLGAAVTMLAELPGWASGWSPPALALLASALAFWLSYADYSRKAGVAAGIAVQCMELAHEWEELWLDADAPNVSSRAKELAGRMIRVTSPALQQHVFEDRNSTSAARKRLMSIGGSLLPTNEVIERQADAYREISESRGYPQGHGYPPRESPPPPAPPRPAPSPQPNPR